jgi:hypothetical protein
MDSVSELEKVFLDALSEFPALVENLQNDMNYSFENEFVGRLAELLVESKFDEAILAKVENENLFVSSSAQAIENGQDLMLEAILASPETPSRYLSQIIERNPNLLTVGIRYIERLCHNPNCPAELLTKMASVALELEDLEICELLAAHPNLPENLLLDLEEFLA